ncbi:DUF3360 family protein, partial [Vibrio splendidus]|uniref:DUF3360 family protein n=1 Tax=Vibrio splendidus TaxID=29497 RepID=UPI0033162122
MPTATLAGRHGPLLPFLPLFFACFFPRLSLFSFIFSVFLLFSLLPFCLLLSNLPPPCFLGGLLLYLGFVGTASQVKNLFAWAGGIGLGHASEPLRWFRR